MSQHFCISYKYNNSGLECVLAIEMPGVETVQPAVPDSSEEGQTEQKEAPAPKPVVGIIYPPPEVWSIL